MKFPVGSLVKHNKTGGIYEIVGVALHEHTYEELYVYRSLATATTWLRNSAEMEDGRFVQVFQEMPKASTLVSVLAEVLYYTEQGNFERVKKQLQTLFGGT